jgi:hypothetical protein
MQRVAALDQRGRDKLMPAVRPRRPANRSPERPARRTRIQQRGASRSRSVARLRVLSTPAERGERRNGLSRGSAMTWPPVPPTVPRSGPGRVRVGGAHDEGILDSGDPGQHRLQCTEVPGPIPPPVATSSVSQRGEDERVDRPLGNGDTAQVFAGLGEQEQRLMSAGAVLAMLPAPAGRFGGFPLPYAARMASPFVAT